jgi:hypothetical protein
VRIREKLRIIALLTGPSIRPILEKSAYERSGVSRGVDPASNGPFQSGGIVKRPEQIHPKAPSGVFWRLDMDRTIMQSVVQNDVKVDRRPFRSAASIIRISHISAFYVEEDPAPPWLPYTEEYLVLDFAPISSDQFDSEEVAVSALLAPARWQFRNDVRKELGKLPPASVKYASVILMFEA